MMKVNKAQIIFEDFDPLEASIPLLRRSLYMVEGWSQCREGECDVVSFDEIAAYFRTWNQNDTPEEERYTTVYDYLIDAIGQGFHPVRFVLGSDRLDRVSCVYTGGGIYVFSARFNNEVWLYGDLDNYFGSYDLPGFVIEEYCNNDYEAHWKTPSVSYPTWTEVINALRREYHTDPGLLQEMEAAIRKSNPCLNTPCIGSDEIPNRNKEE